MKLQSELGENTSIRYTMEHQHRIGNYYKNASIYKRSCVMILYTTGEASVVVFQEIQGGSGDGFSEYFLL